MSYNDILRYKFLLNIFAEMTDEEKRTMIQYMTMDSGQREIVAKLEQQQTQMRQIAQEMGRRSWITDFGSDVAANFFTDGLIWIVRRLCRR